MISSAAEYSWVKGDNVDASHPHGDLDRIVITGDIDPTFADGYAPFRGEIVTFMMEAIGERYAALGGTPDYSFGRSVYGGQNESDYIRDAVLDLKSDVFRRTGVSYYSGFIDADSLGQIVETHSTSDIYPNTAFANITLRESDSASDPSDFRLYMPANNLDAVKRVYADLMKLSVFYRYIGFTDVTPSLYSLTWSDYYVSGNRGNKPAPSGLLYSHWLHGSWVSDGTGENIQYTWIEQCDYTARMNNIALHLNCDAFGLSKAAEVWALVELQDFDSSRYEDNNENISYHSFVKLMDIPAGAIHDTYLEIPANYLVSLCDGLISRAAAATATGKWNTPFLIRNENPYKGKESQVSHRIDVQAVEFYAVCTLRDKTRLDVTNE